MTKVAEPDQLGLKKHFTLRLELDPTSQDLSPFKFYKCTDLVKKTAFIMKNKESRTKSNNLLIEMRFWANEIRWNPQRTHRIKATCRHLLRCDSEIRFLDLANSNRREAL